MFAFFKDFGGKKKVNFTGECRNFVIACKVEYCDQQYSEQCDHD